jgi:periplasmic copper chaperone A
MKHLVTAAFFVASASAWSQSSVDIKDPWVRATVAQQKATGAFMQLTAKAEIHEMAMADNVMKMRQVPGVVLPAGKAVELKPGGYHVMLQDLKAQVKAGDVVPLTLVFENKDGKRESVEVKAPVRPLAAAAANSQAAPAEHKHH